MQAAERVSVRYSQATSGEQQMPPPPVVPPNVLQIGMPEKSASVAVEGSLLDYIPLAEFCAQNSCSWTITGIQYPITAIMAPNGTVHQPKYKVSGKNGALLDVLMIDPASDLGVGTTVQQVLYWQRLSQSWIPANTSHTTHLAVTSGISQSESEMLSFSVGAKVGFNNKINIGLSASLTKSFTSTTTITSQATITDDFPFNAQPAEQVCAVYQLMQSYSVSPGPNLAAYVAQYQAISTSICNTPLGMCQRVEAVLPVVYPTSSYLQIAGTNAAGAPGAQRLRSAAEIREMVLQSVTRHVDPDPA